MTIETTDGSGDPIIKSGPYNGDGVTSAFDYDFQIQADTELTVTRQNADLTETELVLTTDYTVSGVNNDAGGQITLVDPATDAPTGTKLIIQYKGGYQQSTDYSNQGRIQLERLEASLDRVTMHLRTLKEQVDRSVKTDAFGTVDLATLQTNINVLGAISSDLSALAAITAEIVALEAVDSEIATLGPLAADISTVAGIDTDVTTVAGISANVTTLAGINAAISTVAGIAADVSTLAAISANVTTVAGISADVTTVAGDSTEIGALAALTTEIGALGAITADITTVAGIAADVTTVAGIASDVSAVAAGGGVTVEGLTVSAASDPSLTLTNTGNGVDEKSFQLRVNSFGSLQIDALRDDGTTNTDYPLFERDSNGNVISFHGYRNNSRTIKLDWDNRFLGFQGGTSWVGTESNHEFDLKTNDTTRFRIGTSGQLGIGGATYGTDGQVLTSKGAAAAPEWTDAGVPGMVFLQEQEASSDTEIDFTTAVDNSIYGSYLMTYEQVTGASGGTSILLRTSTDGGTTFDDGGSDYAFSMTVKRPGASETGNQANNNGSIFIGWIAPDALADGGANGHFFITGAGEAQYTHIHGQCSNHQSNGNYNVGWFSGSRKAQADADAFRVFLQSADTLATGIFRLYGLLK